MASLRGNALSLIGAVLELVADRRTGVLDVRADGLVTRIYFEDGEPRFAEDGALGETFGRLLVRQGVITSEQFIRVIDEMTLAATGDNQLRFGEVAVGIGVLTQEQVERGLAQQACGIITRSLARDQSQWSFEPSPAAAKPPRSFSIEINPAVLAAMRESPDRSVVADVIAARPEELVVLAGDTRVPEAVESGQAAAAKTGPHGPAGSTHAARMAAEQAFQRGTALLRAAETASAAIELGRASVLQPESLEYLLYATWAEARIRDEIPSESDRQRLLEIAQRAKRRDPMFAFGSYVIGQLSMWAGDDETAKKWFYEALRLDPASEAGQQVRILARRGVGAHAPSGAGEPSDRAGPAERAVSTSEPAQITPVSQRSRAPSGGWAKRLVPGVALLATALLLVAIAKKSPPRAGLATGASPADPKPMDASAPPAVPEGGQTASDSVPAKKSLKAASGKDSDGDDRGTVLLPARASGHRIFVDGRLVKTDGSAPLHLPCGPHVIQIGSAGTPEPIALPCRGEVQLQ